MILHLFRIEKFTEGYLNFINDNFSADDHKFWIYGTRTRDIPLNISLYKNARFYRNLSSVLKVEKLLKFDKIIYHGLFERSIINFFAKNRKLHDRLYLYFWGGDKFYDKDKWENYKKRYVIRNAHAIITIIPEEHRFIRKHYRPKGELFCAQYTSTVRVNSIIDIMQKGRVTETDKKSVSILVGHSAAYTNHHISILHRLARFRDEKIRVYASLSYGSDDDYVQKVIEEGKKLFGEKFFAVTDFMKEEEYYDFLNSMDIGIFDMNRQQALGNITAMIAFGKKVYLRDHSVLSHYFSVTNHFIIYKTSEIEQMSFKDFAYFKWEDAENNKEKMRPLLNIEPKIKKWEMIFDDKM